MDLNCKKLIFVFSLFISVISIFQACFEKNSNSKEGNIYDYIKDPLVLLSDTSFRGVKLRIAVDSLNLDNCKRHYIHEPPCSYAGISYNVNDSIRIEFYTKMTRQNRFTDSCNWNYQLVIDEEILSTIVFYKGLQTRRFEKYKDVYLKLMNKKVHY